MFDWLQSPTLFDVSSVNGVQLTLTLKMTTAQVDEMSVTVNNNSPIQDYVHLDDQTQPTFEMTPGFKPFTKLLKATFAEQAQTKGQMRKSKDNKQGLKSGR